MSVRRDPLMLLIAVALTPLLSGCFDLGFPGGGVSLRGGPYGGTVDVGFPGGGFNLSGGPAGGSLNIGFPGGGVNVGLGPGGGGVSVAAPGVNLNLGIPGRRFFYQDSGNIPFRSQTALFPPTITYQTPVAQVAPPVLQAPPPVVQAPPPASQVPPPPPNKVLQFSQGAPPPLAASSSQPAGVPNGWERGEDSGFDDLRSR